MQTLGIISVNLWTILISLANLLIIFLILKKLLFKPVMKVMEQRKAMVDRQLADAAEAKEAADADKAAWAQKMAEAKTEADEIIGTATVTAKRRSEAIVEEAKAKADGMIRQAETQIDLERKRASAEMRDEIVTISTALAEKMLEREIQVEDHRQLISAFMQEVGEDND